MAARCSEPTLRRMTAVHHGSGGIKRCQKELLIDFEFQRIHRAVRIGDHAVGGDDGVAFDKGRAGRAYQTFHHNNDCESLPTARQTLSSANALFWRPIQAVGCILPTPMLGGFHYQYVPQQLSPHPAAAIFPMMAESELVDLAVGRKSRRSRCALPGPHGKAEVRGRGRSTSARWRPARRRSAPSIPIRRRASTISPVAGSPVPGSGPLCPCPARIGPDPAEDEPNL
jgi:hypothetical protein